MARCDGSLSGRCLLTTFALVVILGVAHAANGQMELAVMQGTVTDDSGRPLDEVTFRIKPVDRGREVIVKSDKNGRFYRRGLQAVEYEIVVEKVGYQPIRDKVKLAAGTDRRFDFKLAAASAQGSDEFTKGVDAFRRGDHQAAAQAFEAALVKAPDQPEVRVNLALVYLRLSRTGDAVAQLEKAAALAPDDPRVQFQLGGAYIEMKDLAKAATALDRGLAGQPDLSNPLSHEAAVTLGAVYFAQGDNGKAQAQFEKTLVAKPDHITSKLGLAKVYFSKSDVDRALQLFEQVAAAKPGSPEAAEADGFIQELRKIKKPPTGSR